MRSACVHVKHMEVSLQSKSNTFMLPLLPRILPICQLTADLNTPVALAPSFQHLFSTWNLIELLTLTPIAKVLNKIANVDTGQYGPL